MGCVQSKKIIHNKIIKIPTNKSQKIDNSEFDINDKKNRFDSHSENIKIKNLITKVDSQVEENYKILNKLGKGSFGSVFKVYHIHTGLIRAMKIIKKENLAYQDGDQKFLNEIKVLIDCEHPNIIKIYEYFSDDTNYYLITEYIAGGELYETIISWKNFNEDKACYIMCQILEAIN